MLLRWAGLGVLGERWWRAEVNDLCWCRALWEQWLSGRGRWSLWAARICVPGRGEALVVGLYMASLLLCSESIVLLVPEWGAVVHAELFVEEDVPGGIDFYPFYGRVPSKFAVVGVRVP